MPFMQMCVACLWALVTYDTIKSIVKDIGVFLTNRRNKNKEKKIEGE